tara:strand:+ start:146 stop:634 length:489 start_codon:yes stop_codon:yes gene_type:complete
MRSFGDILTESKKTYNFIVRVAGDLPEGFVEQLKTNLEKYDLVKISSPKRMPIKEKPADFPQLQNMEVHSFDVEVKYPVTGHVLERYLVDNCNVDHSHLVVRVPGEPVELQQSAKDDKPYEVLLAKEDLGGESAQDKVGANRVMDLLKELEVARKERSVEGE